MTDEPKDGPPEGLPERRKEDKTLEAKLNEAVAHVEARLRRWLIIGIASMAIIAVTSGFALYGYGYVLGRVQDQRREACEDTNQRNEKTTAALKAASILAIGNAHTPAEKRNAIAGRALTLTLINALAPERNCEKVAPDPGYFPL